MTKELKILLFDVETAPNIGYTWEKYETNVIEFIKERYLLTFTAKWLGDSKLTTLGLDDFPGYSKNKECDKELCIKLWEMIDEADVVIGHNSDSFDIKVMNTRFVVNGLLPPSPYRTVDTRKEARKRFGFSSNSLNDLCTLLGIGGKHPTGGFKLWKECMAGDSKAWKKMKKYNKIDVLLLEQLYLKLRPWMKTHPNTAILKEDRCACHICASTNTQRRGTIYNKVTKYQRIFCNDCGSWTQGPIDK